MGLPRSEKHKIAVAVNAAGEIEGHFRASPFFEVFTVEEGRVLDYERRANPYSAEEEDAREALCWKVMEEVLPDVRAVICAGMGESAYAGMLRRDILPLLTPEKDARRALMGYLKGRLRSDERFLHRPYGRPDPGISREGTCSREREGEY